MSFQGQVLTRQSNHWATTTPYVLEGPLSHNIDCLTFANIKAVADLSLYCPSYFPYDCHSFLYHTSEESSLILCILRTLLNLTFPLIIWSYALLASASETVSPIQLTPYTSAKSIASSVMRSALILCAFVESHVKAYHYQASAHSGIRERKVLSVPLSRY